MTLSGKRVACTAVYVYAYFPGYLIYLKVRKAKQLKEKKDSCPRCNVIFTCRPDNIDQCDCSKITLTKEEYRYISSVSSVCLCNTCLKDLQKEYNKKFHFNKPNNKVSGRTGLLLLIFLFSMKSLLSQTYAPAAGQAGTTAMYKDSSAFIAWVSSCNVTRGYQNISDPSLGFASVGDGSLAAGKALSNGVVSLGDGGTAICSFSNQIVNGPGFDFAVFENSIDDSFLELAFVEVSSDGINYFRFPAHSLTDTLQQTGSFGSTDPVKINNLAGKYRAGYGTPFDLQELAGIPGLDVNAIIHVKIIDVIGSINSSYTSRDKNNHKVNDPWPTPFPSSGFDLDAIGVIHQKSATWLREVSGVQAIQVFPNPANRGQIITISHKEDILGVEILDACGTRISSGSVKTINTEAMVPGMYMLRILSPAGYFTTRVVIF